MSLASRRKAAPASKPVARTAPVELKQYDVKLPNRKMLDGLSQAGAILLVWAIAMAVITTVWMVWYFVAVDTYMYEYYDIEPPFGPQLWFFLIFAIIGAVGLIISSSARNRIDKYFGKVHQGEILDMGVDSEGGLYLQLRGFTYANKLNTRVVYPRHKFWVTTQNEWKYEGRRTVQL